MSGEPGGDSTSDDPRRADRAREHLGFSRWWLVVAAVLAMAVISPYQYVWSSIEGPIASDLGLPLPQLGFVFTLFVIVQSGSQFPVGWWRDRHGPRAVTFLAAVLAGGAYFLLAYATAVWQLYALYSLGALGVGIVYTVAVNTAIKWFPDYRGLTTGLGTMAFSAGAALFVPFVRANATVEAYGDVLRAMGVIIGLAILVAAVVLRDPPESWYEHTGADADDGDDSKPAGGRQYTWREMLGTWQFWVMYAMFVGVSGAGLMLTAKLISFAQAMELDAATATVSAILLPLAGGAGRLLIGWLSDRLNRRHAMTLSFSLCGVGLFAVVAFAQSRATLAFLAAVVVATFFWSPQYTLFPSLVADYYGVEHSSANYALVYSGKMWGGVFGGAVTGWLVVATNWTTTFRLGGALALVAGLGALVLRPPAGQKSEESKAVTAD
ncbi:major facilitator superfamily protein [Halogeometricum pallidum JCM 14848]|uniref:Major facilitator superfamily protein n=1 Tax=Halogeometricum pallidum JCM 14848 TaxID=1227487 RepID=M0CYY2_HALPD|nr:OFA family MFS transporter [Halogeometricum pallidum]ELZ28430.1 major facilitator superfamily protein [Halogeometricum pallidum JCM 14848]